MYLFDVFLLPFALINLIGLIGNIITGFESFREWRYARSEDRIRRAISGWGRNA
jgi:hypothetical protein